MIANLRAVFNYLLFRSRRRQSREAFAGVVPASLVRGVEGGAGEEEETGGDGPQEEGEGRDGAKERGRGAQEKVRLLQMTNVSIIDP